MAQTQPDFISFGDLPQEFFPELDPLAPSEVQDLPDEDVDVDFGADFGMNFITGELIITSGGDLVLTDENRALEQWVTAALITPRGEDIIYQDQFGSGLHELLGAGLPVDAMVNEVPGRIREALLVHDRINDVDFTDFLFTPPDFAPDADPLFIVSFNVILDTDDVIAFEGLSIG